MKACAKREIWFCFWDLELVSTIQIIPNRMRNLYQHLKGEYLDMYKRMQTEVISTTRFDENSDLSTT